MNPIIEKIKKLLRMKRGGTPDEVATALRLAQELAEKHGIDLNAVNPDDDGQREKPISHNDEVLGARASWESKYAGLVVSQFFKVSVFRSVNAGQQTEIRSGMKGVTLRGQAIPVSPERNLLS